MSSSWNILQTGMGRRPRCRWKKCNKWFGEQAWFYIYDHRYFCSPNCVVEYCLVHTPEQSVTELDFRIKAVPIPKRLPNRNFFGQPKVSEDRGLPPDEFFAKKNAEFLMKRSCRCIAIGWEPETEFKGGRHIIKGIELLPIAITPGMEQKLSGSIEVGEVDPTFLALLINARREEEERRKK